MKKILVLMLVLSLALMFIGCSDDDNNDTTPAVTKVSIDNQTNADITVVIDGVDGTLVAGETWSYTFDNAIFDEDVEMITANYMVSGLYIATEERIVNINKNQNTTVDITAEGGVITLRNDYYFDIVDVRINNDGANIIDNPLATGDSINVLLDPETYSITLDLENDDRETINDITVSDNQLTQVIFDKHVFSLTNNTTSAISYRLDSETLNTVAASETAERELGDEFGSMVEFYYNGLYVFDQTLNLDFDAQSYYHFDLDAQGGAIFVVNGTQDNITEVYISRSSDTEWGPDYMAGSITPGNQFAWTVEAGLWDVKIVDDAGFYSEIYDIQVNLNQSEYVDYSDKAKTRGTSTNMKNKAHYNYPVGGTRVEGN